MKPQQFASDNYSGVCPEVFETLKRANENDLPAYGNDIWSTRAADMLRQFFETDCDVFFVFNGTAANSLALASLCQSYHSVVSTEVAHIETDECGAPEFFSNGSKLLLAPATQGKLTPEGIRGVINKRSDIHYPKPKVISLTQQTELGTAYSLNELSAIKAVAQELDLKVHMDGARFFNSLVHLGCSAADMTWRSGVDVLCLGGTKNGLSIGEAVIFFDKALAEDFAYRCKQAGQLCSKMRFLSCQWVALLENQVWQKNAANANHMAAYFAQQLKKIPQVEILFPVQGNGIFIELPLAVKTTLLEKGWHFYSFIGVGGARLMTSWNTTEATIDAFIADLLRAV